MSAGGASSASAITPSTPTRTVGRVRGVEQVAGATPDQRPTQAHRRSITLDFGDVNPNADAGLRAHEQHKDVLPKRRKHAQVVQLPGLEGPHRRQHDPDHQGVRQEDHLRRVVHDAGGDGHGRGRPAQGQARERRRRGQLQQAPARLHLDRL